LCTANLGIETIVRRALHGYRWNSSQSEVEDLDQSICRDHYVRALEIAMKQSPSVSSFQRLANFCSNFERLVEVDRAALAFWCESFAIDVFHSYGRLIACLTKFVYGGDIRMCERRSHLSFSLQSCCGLLIPHEVGRKELDGNCAFELEVFGLPDLSL